MAHAETPRQTIAQQFNIHEATVDIILIVDKADRTEVRFIRDVPTPTLQALGPSLSSQADILAGCAIVLRCGAMATKVCPCASVHSDGEPRMGVTREDAADYADPECGTCDGTGLTDNGGTP